MGQGALGGLSKLRGLPGDRKPGDKKEKNFEPPAKAETLTSTHSTAAAVTVAAATTIQRGVPTDDSAASKMDSGSDSDGAPEELTAVQGVEKHEEISKVEKDTAAHKMDSGSDSDGAPEELTAVQGVEKHEEISKVEKDTAVHKMDSGSDSDGAPEELTAVQGVEKHEEISKVEKDSAVRAAKEEKDRRKRWAQRKTSSKSNKKRPLKVEDKDVKVKEVEDEQPQAMRGTLPESVIAMLAARDKQTFSSDSEEEIVNQKIQKKKKKLKTSGPETILLKDVRSTQHVQNALDFLNRRKNQVPRSNAVLKNSHKAMRLFHTNFKS